MLLIAKDQLFNYVKKTHPFEQSDGKMTIFEDYDKLLIKYFT